MDPVRNPYGPGAGTPPPELAGRGAILAAVEIALARKRIGRPSKGVILTGLRGVGKTVLLNRILEIANDQGYRSVQIEVNEERSLAMTLVPAIRSVLFDLDRMGGVNERVKRGLRVLRSFIGNVSFKVGEIDMTLGIDPEVGTADSGDLDADFAELLLAVGEAAAGRGTAVALVVDELQYLSERDFAALIGALHRVNQRSLPIVFVGAALPSVRGIAGEAKSYAERLFDFPTIGALEPADARDAIQEPAMREGVRFAEDALDEIIAVTRGYPYFLQEWAYHAWNVAASSPVTTHDVRNANDRTVRALDESFFRVRLDRLTPSEKRYLRAIAALGGEGPFRSADIASELRAKLTSVGPTRAKLISKGMIYSTAHGETSYTVPLFGEFMLRAFPQP